MVVETEIRKLREEVKTQFAEMRMLLLGKNIVGTWVSQQVACAQLNILPRRLRDIRLHANKMGKMQGSIRWRKGNGKMVQYHKGDIEKYLSQTTMQ